MSLCKQKIILDNYKLITSVAWEWKNDKLPYEPLDNLINIGVLGMFKAIDNYDPKHIPKTKFSTYARSTIYYTFQNYFNKLKKQRQNEIYLEDIVNDKTNKYLINNDIENNIINACINPYIYDIINNIISKYSNKQKLILKSYLKSIHEEMAFPYKKVSQQYNVSTSYIYSTIKDFKNVLKKELVKQDIL